MALVGILESLMTAKFVDEITDTHSNKTRETWGQGVANVMSGLFGGMGGMGGMGHYAAGTQGPSNWTPIA